VHGFCCMHCCASQAASPSSWRVLLALMLFTQSHAGDHVSSCMHPPQPLGFPNKLL
jgi:hypothetical protein